DMPAIRVGARPSTATGNLQPLDLVPADASGRFTLSGLLPGKYRLYVQVPTNPITQAPEWFAKTGVVGGHDVLDAPLEIKAEGAIGEAVITLTDDTQEVSGIVRDATGHAVSDGTVAIFSVDRQFWFPQSRRVVLRSTGVDGLYVFGM